MYKMTVIYIYITYSNNLHFGIYLNELERSELSHITRSNLCKLKVYSIVCLNIATGNLNLHDYNTIVTLFKNWIMQKIEIGKYLSDC